MEYSLESKSVRKITTITALSIIVLAGVLWILAGEAHAATGFGSIQVTEVVKGGTANPSDFTVQVKENGVGSSGTLSGSGGVITFTQLTPGTYTLSESGGPSGYSTSWSGACNAQGNVTVVANATASCTATNTFGPVGSIQVTDIVKGGTATASNFTVHIAKIGTVDTGSPSGSGSVVTFNQLTPGTYAVIESGMPSGYTTSWSGACNAQGNVTVVANATASCTVTNTFIPPTSGGSGNGGGSGRSRPNPPVRPSR